MDIMPVSQENANPIRFDGPPRIIGLGFQVADAQLIGPVDLFDDPHLMKQENNLHKLLIISEDMVLLNHIDYLVKKWNIPHYLV